MTFLSRPKLADDAGRLAALHRYEILDTEPEREFDEIIRLVKGIFGVPIAAVSFIAEDRQWFKAEAGLGVAGTPREVAFCDTTIRSAGAFAVENAPRDPLFAANPLVTGEPHIRCYLGVPLTTPDGYNVGSLCVIGTEPRHFTDEEAELLASFGRLVVSQLELRALARRDGLTGALSRRAFEEAMRAAIRSAVRPLSLLFFDIDHFKVVNDRWGHPAGDIVIRAVAGAIAGRLGPGDRLGRLGGEEFALLSPANGPDAAARAERIREAVAALAIPDIGSHPVTVSCGIAPWTEARGGPSGWMAAADVGLYAAKRGGRNRVVLAG